MTAKRSRSASTTRSSVAVVGLGLCVVDHVYTVERLGTAIERTRYVERLECAGGMTANALVQAARMGCRARVLSAVGDDEAGRWLARALREAGVSTRGLLRTPRLQTTVAVVLVDRRSGARRFIVPARRALERRAPRFDLTAIRRESVLLVDGHFPVQAARAVRYARAEGVPVVGDFNRPSREICALLPFVDHAIVPLEFAAAFTPGRPRDTLAKLRDDFGCEAIVTRGARGGWFLDGGRVRTFSSPRVHVRDTTGAGDAFHGAFAAGLAQGLPLERNLARAARAGAQCCTHVGGPAATAR